MEGRESDCILESHIDVLKNGICTNNDIINAMRELSDTADISDYFSELVKLLKEVINYEIKNKINTEAAVAVNNGANIDDIAERLAKSQIGFNYKKELDPNNEWAKYLII